MADADRIPEAHRRDSRSIALTIGTQRAPAGGRPGHARVRRASSVGACVECERAGLTPPALYRYFPNKYALLSESGQRLMQRQNERVDHWITLEVFSGDLDVLERAVEALILDT